MDLRKLKSIIDLLKEAGISEIDLTEGEDRVRIVNSPDGIRSQATSYGNTPALSAQPSATPQEVKTPSATTTPTVETINAPMVGTFYRAPSPGAKPFVSVGQKVRAGETVCIIEAMKLLNEIEAEFDGEIVKILVENGDPVEFGQALFEIRR
ncbi:MAG TPA: acetyl-CoA carboxylase biotin carboxyl carrier protein [Sutterella sp.]|nr:acetyl-CoA carboxylase biotin carboxyl carrier protein [Sutterella sp.]